MIEVDGLRMRYNGAEVLHGISLRVPAGAIYGFIGPNGAGKTTTLKILGTLLKPTGGSARVLGRDVRSDAEAVRRLVGWMPDQYGVYADLKVWEYLDFFAGAYGLARARRREVIDMVLGLVGLEHKRESLLSGLSRGMTQRLCLGRALLHEPQVLLLDEPASGLDPQARVELRELFKELQRMGKTLLVSSHILPELAEYCTGVAIIQDGRVRFSGTMEEVAVATGEGVRRVRVEVLGPRERARELLTTRKEVLAVALAAGSERALDCEVAGDSETLADLLAFLVAEKLRVCRFEEAAPDLSDVFMKITRPEQPS